MKTDPQWDKIGKRHHHGVVIPLFALRSQNSCGIGEFFDLIPMIDWCASLNLDVIQLLPINDTAEDPSPYNAASSCALEPSYLSLKALPNIGNLDFTVFQPLTELQKVARNEVRRLKLTWLYDYFLINFKVVSEQKPYIEFVKKQDWLCDYAEFKNDGRKDFHYFIQYLCFDQMAKVKEHASSKNIFLKGDIPILLSQYSADVVADPKLFDLSLDAGAPPDFFNSEGQHWGFPLMNWDAMRATGFQWWKRRLKIAEEFFHIYRIDHVVGLFRIWGIPKGDKPINGHFVPTDHTLWQPQGRQILEMMIDSTSMLPIAEDLGVVPQEVIQILQELGICGTKVIRWKRRWGGNLDYVPYEEYEPYNLTTITTHDAEPLLLWWKNQPEEAALYAKFKHWEYTPELNISGRIEILKDSHKTPTYFHVNPLQEYQTIFPEFSWGLPEDERINVPGTLLPANWTYRFKPYVEEIIASKELADLFKSCLPASH